MGTKYHPSFFSFGAKKCACSVYKSTKSCCEDQQQIVKIESDQSTAQIVSIAVPQFVFLTDIFSFAALSIKKMEVQEFSSAELLQLPPKVPIYQSICSLVFYDSIG